MYSSCMIAAAFLLCGRKQEEMVHSAEGLRVQLANLHHHQLDTFCILQALQFWL